MKSPLRSSIAFCAALLLATSAGAGAGDLRDAVRDPDPSYAFEIVGGGTVGACEASILKLTSQTWRGMEWHHWLSILVPDEVEHTDRAILFISGGSNRSKRPRADSSEALMLATLAARSKAVLAILQQVPNQPLFDGRKEDRLIAFTFDKFLDGKGDDWPLLVPMVESAVRAMDTVQTVTTEQFGMDVKEFIVSGASKRGWTTWLTAAADDRVSAIAPMVIDMLNLRPQMERQRLTYGGFSEQIEPYTELNIQERMESELGQELTRRVDPFEYRDILTLPKLVVLGTNDPYWTVNASSLYFPELVGPKNLFYLPNAGHGLGIGILPTMTAFFRASLAGGTLPALDWQTLEEADGRHLRASWTEDDAEARLWQAHSDNRDFRKSRWSATPLEGARSCEALIAPPEEGWSASYIEVEFMDAEGDAYTLCTEISVLPELFPHAAESAPEEDSPSDA